MKETTRADKMFEQIRDIATQLEEELLLNDDVTSETFRHIKCPLDRIIDATLDSHEPRLYLSDGNQIGIGDVVYTVQGTELIVKGFVYEEDGWLVRCSEYGRSLSSLYRTDEIVRNCPWDNRRVVETAVQVGRKFRNMTEKEVKEWVDDLVERARKAPDNE